MKRLNRVPLCCLAATLACSRGGGDRASQGADTTGTLSAPSSASDAIAAVGQRYQAHFASGQGFSVDTLRARQAWFTPQLYQLMLADMSSTGEIGYIDFDPFTDGQDDAASYTVGTARRAHDTVFVEVAIAFPGAVGNGHEQHRVTLAMLRARAGWQIANFVYPDRDLARDLARSASDHSVTTKDSGSRDATP
jgi:hypothetical protein